MFYIFTQYLFFKIWEAQGCEQKQTEEDSEMNRSVRAAVSGWSILCIEDIQCTTVKLSFSKVVLLLLAWCCVFFHCNIRQVKLLSALLCVLHLQYKADEIIVRFKGAQLPLQKHSKQMLMWYQAALNCHCVHQHLEYCMEKATLVFGSWTEWWLQCWKWRVPL